MANRIARFIAGNPDTTLTPHQIYQTFCSPQSNGGLGFSFAEWNEERQRQLRKERLEKFGDYRNITPAKCRKWKSSMDRQARREERRDAVQSKYGNMPSIDQLLFEYADDEVFDAPEPDEIDACYYERDAELYHEYQRVLRVHRLDTGLINAFASSFEVFLDNRWRFDEYDRPYFNYDFYGSDYYFDEPFGDDYLCGEGYTPY